MTALAARARMLAYLQQSGLSTARAEANIQAVLDEHAHQLADQQREDIDLTAHSGESIYPCEDCAVVRAAASIDPEAQS